MEYHQIPQNPYIVGNPIQSGAMFYGRNEDFLYIRDKLQKEARGLIITLAGERRSGKTSILFQILGGRLGPEYLPFFVDMQAMAAVESDAQFLSRLDSVIRTQIAEQLPEQDYQADKWSGFENFLSSLKQQYPGKKIIFLLDEYELIESKIDQQMITEALITFFANLMENHNIFFLFTGSNKLEDRVASYWKTLFSKSQYRKITFLKKQDCINLITMPVESYVNYTPEQLDKIWRLTAGQPFYTQIFCQNMVDRLQIEQHNDVLDADIEAVIADIVDNPMPQMIYFWQELDAKHKLTLSLMAELLSADEGWVETGDLVDNLKKQQLNLAINAADFHTALEELYHSDILTKKGKQYQFRVDIFRYWIKQEQNVWKLLNEIQLPKASAPRRLPLIPILITILVILCLAGGTYLLLKPHSEFGWSKSRDAVRQYKQAQNFFEDNNYSLALQTVDYALSADSLFLKAHKLKADIYNAMQKPEEALIEYKTAERLYYKQKADFGKVIGRVPETPENVKAQIFEQKNIGGFLILLNTADNTNTPVRMGSRSDTNGHIDSSFYAYYLKKRQWFSFPNSVQLKCTKSRIYYYNLKDNSFRCFNANNGCDVWKSNLDFFSINPNLKLAESTVKKWDKGKSSVWFNSNSILLINHRTGKLLAQRKFASENILSCTIFAKYKKVMVATDEKQYILSLDDFRQLKVDKALYKLKPGFRLFAPKVNVVSRYEYEDDKEYLLRFNQKTNKLEKLSIIGLNHGKFTSDKENYIIYKDGSTLYRYDFHTNRSHVEYIFLGSEVEKLYTQYHHDKPTDFLVIKANTGMIVYDINKSKVKYQVAINSLPDYKTNKPPEAMSYDPYHERLLMYYPDDSEISGVHNFCIYDLQTDKALFTNSLNYYYQEIEINKHFYTFSNQVSFSVGNGMVKKCDLLLIQPENYQVFRLDKLENAYNSKNALHVISGKNIHKISKFPAQEDKLLQAIQENIIQISNQTSRWVAALDTFTKMQLYVRAIKNSQTALSIISSVIALKPDELGVYADKLMALYPDYKSIRNAIDKTMQLITSSRFSTFIQVQSDESTLTSRGDHLIEMTFDRAKNEGKVNIMRDSQKWELFTYTKSVNFFGDDNIFQYAQQGKPTKLIMLDKQNQVFQYKMPFSVDSNFAATWLNDNTVIYIIQKPLSDGFEYKMNSIEKTTGKITTLSSWHSNQHLKGLVTKDNKIGFIWADSLKTINYIKTPGSKTNLPDLAQILTINGYKVTKVSQLKSVSGQVASINISNNGRNDFGYISADVLDSAVFTTVTMRYVQWYDFTTHKFENPIKWSLACINDDSKIKVYGKIDRWLIESNWVGLCRRYQSIDLSTGKVNVFHTSKNNEHELYTAKTIQGSTFFNYTYDEQSVQGILCHSRLNSGGDFNAIWTTTLPFNFAYSIEENPSIITVFGNKLIHDKLAYYLAYIDKKTGKVISIHPIYSGMQCLTFDNQPPLLYHKKLGFYELPPIGNQTKTANPNQPSTSKPDLAKNLLQAEYKYLRAQREQAQAILNDLQQELKQRETEEAKKKSKPHTTK